MDDLEFSDEGIEDEADEDFTDNAYIDEFLDSAAQPLQINRQPEKDYNQSRKRLDSIQEESESSNAIESRAEGSRKVTSDKLRQSIHDMESQMDIPDEEEDDMSFEKILQEEDQSLRFRGDGAKDRKQSNQMNAEEVEKFKQLMKDIEE